MRQENYITFKNTAILVILLTFVVVMTIWNLPSEHPARKAIYNDVRMFVQYPGLWQNWAMFAPNPVRSEVHVKILGTTRSGEEIEYEPYYMTGGLIFTRDRKFHSNIVWDWPAFREPYLYYWCGRMNEHDVGNIKLLVRKQPILMRPHEKWSLIPYQNLAEVNC